MQKTKNSFWIVCVCLVLNSCGFRSLDIIDQEKKSFYVKEINPVHGSQLEDLKAVTIQFSQEVLLPTIISQNIFVVRKTDYEKYGEDWDDLYDDVLENKVIPLQTHLEWDSHDKSVILTFTDNTVTSADYVIVVLPKVLSRDYYPLNQTTSGDVRKFFRSYFSVVKLNNAEKPQGVDSPVSPDSISPENSPSSSDLQNPIDSIDTTTTENQNTSDDVTLDSVDEAVVEEPQLSAEEIENLAKEFYVGKIVITEVVTDPQQDHNESSGGNGVLFDFFPGNGSVTTSDEYIEIYNGTEESVDLSGWSLNMVDDNTQKQTLDDSGWHHSFSKDGSLDSFQPGEVLVLGNPNGSLNNTVLIELADANGEIIDSIDIEDATAENLDEEAYFFDKTTAEWIQGQTSAGAF